MDDDSSRVLREYMVAAARDHRSVLVRPPPNSPQWEGQNVLSHRLGLYHKMLDSE